MKMKKRNSKRVVKQPKQWKKKKQVDGKKRGARTSKGKLS